jgi:predicted TIM-barrel fold metal-dependent hydrolase
MRLIEQERIMRQPTQGAIDCDVHVSVPSVGALLPYCDDYWRDQFRIRGIDRLDFSLTAYPPNAPLSGKPADLPAMRAHLDRFGLRAAIAQCLHGSMALHSEDMAAAFCRAINDWMRAEWLDAEPRLFAAITVPMQSPDLAAAEIERCAADGRFVQVLVPAMTDMPLGRRFYWPLYQAAERHGLPVGIHAGGMFRHAPTPTGWPSYIIEDYAAQAQAFDSQLLSLITEGVFTKFPGLTVVLLESGITWLPPFLWRTNKIWRGLRPDAPWVDRAPPDIVRERVRLTLQPFDAPEDAGKVRATLRHIGGDGMLLFSTDFPHCQFDGDRALPVGFPAEMLPGLLTGNAMATYPRLAAALRETVA